jgi:putative transposase
MQVLKAYKYRIYPNKIQAAFLNQTFGCVRFVWNQLVANFNSWTHDVTPPKISEKTLKDMPEYSFLKDTISYALQQKRMDFDEAKSQYFNKNRKTKLGRMQFKKKGTSRDSFRIPGQALGFKKCIDFETGTIKLPKMTPIKAVFDRKFEGTLKSVTISKNKCNQYFVSILVEEEVELKQNTGRSVGIDLGLTHLVTLSNGTKITNPRWFRESQSKLARAQQHLSRKVRGSNRHNKQKLKVAKVYLKTASPRCWFHHNLSKWLVENYDNILMEDLNIAGMKKSNLAKSVSDAGWASLVSKIEYKSRWTGRSFHKVDRWFASSKTCSYCGHKVQLTLADRDWTCSSCGTHHDRDGNAATNILHRGLQDLYAFTSAELADYVRGENVRPMTELHSLIGNLCEANSQDSICYRTT